MDFSLSLSLKGLALTAAAVAMWKPSKSYFANASEKEFSKVFLKVKRKVMAEARKFELPGLLKTQLLRYVDAVGREMLWWAGFTTGLQLRKRIPDDFFWTPHGTIDLLKTANAMVCDETIMVADRYLLACIYCLEHHIPLLWNRLSRIECAAINLMGLHFSPTFSLVTYWSHYLQGTLDYIYRNSMPVDNSFKAPNPSGLLFSVLCGSEIAAKFFLLKLTDEEKEKILVKTASMLLLHLQRNDVVDRQRTQILCLLLNGMNKEQQVEVLKRDPEAVLKCFVNWPWQDHFMKMYQCGVYNFFSDSEFYRLLKHILDKRCRGFEDYDYQQLFIEFWQHSPIIHRKCVIDHCKQVFTMLYELEDWKTLSITLECETVEQREQLLFSPTMCYTYKALIDQGKFSSLEHFIAQCCPSDDEIRAFKAQMSKFYSQLRHTRRYQNLYNKWLKFLKYFDDITRSKKHCTEDSGSKAKRRCLT